MNTEQHLNELIEHARENERKLQRFQAVELNLIGSHTLLELLDHLRDFFRLGTSLEVATLALVDRDHEIRRLVEEHELDAAELADLIPVANKTDCERLYALGLFPHLRAFRPAADGWLFPDPPSPASVALLPLARRGSVIGSLNLGSKDPERFTDGVRSDFLERLAAVTGICVENTLNFHRLHHAGLTDAVTGVRNRRFLDERLVEELSRARRQRKPLGFLFLDIDHFKQVNDRYGHPAGDAVLHDVAQRIIAALRVTDVLTRYGGEEFAALLPDTDAATACQVAERIRAKIADEPFVLSDGAAVPVTISIGAAVLSARELAESDGDHKISLTKNADNAVLRAKQSGRNRVVCHGDTDSDRR